MPKILVLYYSSYGHIEMMAHAQAAGVAKVPNAQATVKRVAELCPIDVAKASGFKLDQPAPLAQPDELEHTMRSFCTPLRFGNMARKCQFSDQTGHLWGRRAGRQVSSVFAAPPANAATRTRYLFS